MKKQITVAFLLVLLLLLNTNETHAADNDFMWIGVSWCTDFLAVSSSHKLKDNWGFEFGGILGFSHSTEDYPCPHGSYTIIDEEDLLWGFGLDGLYLIPIKQFTLYGGGGVYWYKYQIVACSHATGWLYQQDWFGKFRLAYSVGAKLKLTEKWGLGAGYHSERGFNIQVGYNVKN